MKISLSIPEDNYNPLNTFGEIAIKVVDKIKSTLQEVEYDEKLLHDDYENFFLMGFVHRKEIIDAIVIKHDELYRVNEIFHYFLVLDPPAIIKYFNKPFLLY